MEKVSFDYKAIFNHLPYPFTIGEIQYDATGEPNDFYILASNEAFKNIVNNTKNQTLCTNLLQIDAKFLLNLNRVITTGNSINFSYFFPILNKTFNLDAFQCNDFLAITWKEETTDQRLNDQIDENEVSANYELINQELRSANNEIKAVNRKLILQEQLFKDLVDKGTDIFILWDEPDKVIYINDRFVDIFEREKEELNGSFVKLFSWIQQEERLEIIHAFEESWEKNNNTIALEIPIVTPSGKVKWIWYRESIFTNNNESNRRVSLATEITKKNDATTKSNEYHQLLENILDKLPMGMQMFNAEGYCTKVNNRFKELNLFPQHLNLNQYKESTQASLIARSHYFDDLFQQENLLKREFFVSENHPSPYNLHKAYKETAFTVKDANGKIKSLVSLIEDITDRKQAENAFFESEEKFRQLIESVDIIFWIREASHENFVYANPAYQQILDSDPLELYKNAKVLLEKVHPQDHKKLNDFIENSFSREIKDFECRMIVNGKVKWLRINSYLLNSKIAGLRQIAIAEDVTFLKKAMEMVLQKNTELLKTNQELDQFVYRVSHNLRAPLTSILGLLELMTMHGLEEELAKYCSLIKKSISGLDYIIQEIVDYSKNARTQIVFDPIDLKAIIDETLENLNYLRENKNIQIEKTINIEKEIASDQERLKILFNNILSNSLKYCDPKKPVNLLFIKAVLDNGNLIVEIKDNGMGIHPDHKGKIFDLFYRGTDMSKGAGLGLAIAKEILNKLNAECELQSEVGTGTTFILRIPVKVIQ